jgi:hypothetical protein
LAKNKKEKQSERIKRFSEKVIKLKIIQYQKKRGKQKVEYEKVLKFVLCPKK